MSFRCSIIIPTYNRAALLKKALSSVQRLEPPEGCEAEVLVIDNNCTDDTAEVARGSGADGPLPVRHIVERSQGLNHGRNRGIREAKFEHLIYLDDDMIVAPGWLKGYLEAQQALEADAVVGPVDPEFEVAAADWMTPRMLETVTSAYSQKGEAMFLLPPDRAHELPGCNFAVRARTAREIGGFHPALDRCGRGLLAGGDWEFGERLVGAGKRVAYSPHCRIRHLISRAKLSRDGLRKRFKGVGATHRACMILKDSDIQAARRARLFLRMLRLYGRSFGCRARLHGEAAFRWELEALYLRGLLFAFPRDLEPAMPEFPRD